MGQELQRRTPARPARPPDPPWRTVARTTLRLWLERRHLISPRPSDRRRRLVVLLSALLAMAVGAGVTLALTQPGEQPTTRPSGAAPATTALQVAAADRHQAAAWIAAQVGSNVVVGCDPEMCAELQNSGFPAGQLKELQPSAPDPLGTVLVVATPVIRNQFGARLASVYAPLVIASFGSGPEQVEVRYVPPDGTAAFEAQLATDQKNRIAAGEQLLTNRNVQASATARKALLAGQVDPRLLVTLSALAHLWPLHLITFVDSSPGVSSGVPLRGAEIGAAAAAGLPAMVAFLSAQRTPFAPAVARITQIAGGQSVVTVRYNAPGPMGLGGS